MAMAKITTKKVQTVDSNGKSEIDLSMNFKKKYFILTFLWHFWYLTHLLWSALFATLLHHNILFIRVMIGHFQFKMEHEIRI